MGAFGGHRRSLDCSVIILFRLEAGMDLVAERAFDFGAASNYTTRNLYKILPAFSVHFFFFFFSQKTFGPSYICLAFVSQEIKNYCHDLSYFGKLSIGNMIGLRMNAVW